MRVERLLLSGQAWLAHMDPELEEFGIIANFCVDSRNPGGRSYSRRFVAPRPFLDLLLCLCGVLDPFQAP